MAPDGYFKSIHSTETCKKHASMGGKYTGQLELTALMLETII